MADYEHSWYRAAACRGAPAEVFFPEPGTERFAAALEAARACCATCPVRAACLAAGMGEDHGIWGGLDPAERRALGRPHKGQAA